MEKVVIIGGGASGIFSALCVREKYEDVSIEIIEKESKLGKKLRATGNGHANLLNDNFDLANYNLRSDLFLNIINEFSANDLIEQYRKWSVPLIRIGSLYYPMSFNAPSFVNELEKKLEERDIQVKLNTSVVDYHLSNGKIIVQASDGNISCDKLIITSGGLSSPKLGSDGSLISALNSHGYDFAPLEAGLTPIKTKERIIKPLVGLRHKCVASLTDGYGPTLYSEEGEFLYKKDGISGICIMNISSKIKWMKLKRPLIHIDLFPGFNVSDFVSEKNKNEAVLESSLYSEVLYQAKCRGMKLEDAVHDLVYSYEGDYGFENSQVTIGGIKGESLNRDLSSNIEDNIYFAGEILDIDGLCGGFNLAWALISSMVVGRSI